MREKLVLQSDSGLNKRGKCKIQVHPVGSGAEYCEESYLELFLVSVLLYCPNLGGTHEHSSSLFQVLVASSLFLKFLRKLLH